MSGRDTHAASGTSRKKTRVVHDSFTSETARENERERESKGVREGEQGRRNEPRNTMVDTVNPRCRFDFIAALTPGNAGRVVRGF